MGWSGLGLDSRRGATSKPTLPGSIRSPCSSVQVSSVYTQHGAWIPVITLPTRVTPAFLVAVTYTRLIVANSTSPRVNLGDGSTPVP